MNKFTKAIAAIMLIVAVTFVAGCNKPDEPNNGNSDSDVRVTTFTPQDITATTAVCGGDAIVVQGFSLTELGVCWSKEQNPTADQFHLSTTDWNEPFACTLTGLESETKYYVRAYALRGLQYYYGDEKCFTTENNGNGNVYEYVDLGLPSGILWATCNIGADTPDGDGDYYAWGETEPKTMYTWNSYKYYYSSLNGSYLTKYNEADGLTDLQPIDDAATINWGGGWRVPTKDEWEELRENTTCTWMPRKGVLFTASNGQSLFLPASGVKGEMEINNNFGNYWSSNSYLPNRAWYFGFVCEDDESCFYFINDNSACRYIGRPIRPVRSAE